MGVAPINRLYQKKKESYFITKKCLKEYRKEAN